LNVIILRAPADGAVPSGLHSLVPERRIESSASVAPVPLTSVKLEAPAASPSPESSAKAANSTSLFMRPSISPSA